MHCWILLGGNGADDHPALTQRRPGRSISGARASTQKPAHGSPNCASGLPSLSIKRACDPATKKGTRGPASERVLAWTGQPDFSGGAFKSMTRPELGMSLNR